MPEVWMKRKRAAKRGKPDDPKVWPSRWGSNHDGSARRKGQNPYVPFTAFYDVGMSVASNKSCAFFRWWWRLKGLTTLQELHHEGNSQEDEDDGCEHQGKFEPEHCILAFYEVCRDFVPIASNDQSRFMSPSPDTSPTFPKSVQHYYHPFHRLQQQVHNVRHPRENN